MLIDNHGRKIDYLRIAVTDRCNLRCFYCMPEEGIEYIERSELMTYEEMHRIVSVGHSLGIKKVRITGGEPFLRKGLLSFLESISILDNLKIHITSNGTLLTQHLDFLLKLGIKDINLSLDTLDRKKFNDITRRDELPIVLDCLHQMIDKGFNVKINMVVMKGRNVEDIIPMAQLAKEYPVDVRFLEEMPFNGDDSIQDKLVDYIQITNVLKSALLGFKKVQDPDNSTSYNYTADNFKGKLGVIASYSRTFCGTCNRLRLTPQGLLKTCLYDSGVFNIKDLIRNGASDQDVSFALINALSHRAKDGVEAEQGRFKNLPISESMATIGG